MQLTPPSSVESLRWCGQLVQTGAEWKFHVSTEFNTIPGVVAVPADRTLSLPEDIGDYRVDWLVGLHAWCARTRGQERRERDAIAAENEKLKSLLRQSRADRRSPSPPPRDELLASCLAKLCDIEERKAGRVTAPQEGRSAHKVDSVAEWDVTHFASDSAAERLSERLYTRLVATYADSEHGGSTLVTMYDGLHTWIAAAARGDGLAEDAGQIAVGDYLFYRVKAWWWQCHTKGVLRATDLLEKWQTDSPSTGNLDRLAKKELEKAKKKDTSRKGNNTNTSHPTKSRPSIKWCSFCKKRGHDEAGCWAKHGRPSASGKEGARQ
jgi:hypothetical protein